MFDDNRRKYPRANYPCQLTVWVEEGVNETILAKTSNVGLGGLCVRLDQELELGVKVAIQLNFPHTTTPFRCNGVVVRCRKEGVRLHILGIQFDPLTELKHAYLDGKVSELIELEKKGKS